MRLYEIPPKTAKRPTAFIDVTKPIMVFDEWLWEGHSVNIKATDHYHLDGEVLTFRDGHGVRSAIHESNGPHFFATATDGLMVFGNAQALDRYFAS